MLISIAPSVFSGAKPINHPDGKLGRINGFATFDYSSAYTVPEDLINDKLIPGAGLAIPISRQIRIKGAISISTGDTLFYNYSFGFKFYFGNPLRDNNHINPDGAVGLPVLEIIAGLSMSDIKIKENQYFSDISLLMPLSQKLSFGFGGKIYEVENIYQVDNFYGIINFFPSPYKLNNSYANPDGSLGTPSFLAKGGGSKYGLVGVLDINIPLTETTTLVFHFKGERAADPYLRQATLGAGIHYYPGN